jgi:DNA-binding response OmpR family regulator
MQKTLRIVMLEDRPQDALLVQDKLREGGFVFSFDRVETKQQFIQELHTHKPDLILSDHGLPSFDGFSALRLVKTECPEVPFVFVTSALGEEFAIRGFESGATDYVLKHHLEDLVPAVRRALQVAEESRQRRHLEQQLRRSATSFRLILDSVKDYALYLLDAEGRISTWNTGAPTD